MARTQPQVLDYLLSITPPGWAWNHAPDGMLANMLQPLAAEIARYEGLAEEQTVEVDPRQAIYLLPAYERVLGPDPDGEVATTLAERQALAYRRWTARGGCSIPDVEAVGTAFGVVVTVTELRRNCAGVAKAGRPVRTNPEQFVWIVTLAPNALIQAIIQGMAPAHTVVVFQFVATPGLWDQSVWGGGTWT